MAQRSQCYMQGLRTRAAGSGKAWYWSKWDVLRGMIWGNQSGSIAACIPSYPSEPNQQESTSLH